jgi:hypothetical protein
MRHTLLPLAGVLLLAAALSAAEPVAPVPDPRHLSNGHRLPGESYCDQPYIARTDDGAWLCVMTTAQGPEGSATQNIIAMRSTDRGKTWSAPVSVEPPGGPEASYAVLLKTPYGRVYCFYNHNTDNVREVKREDGGVYTRVDSLGHYVFRYSDDGGRTWSPRRYEVPVREFACDRENVYQGRLRFFWNVGRPLVLGESVLLTLHKVGAMGAGFFAQSEGVFLRSANLLTERDPARIRFETLPDGDVGLRAPPGGGRVAEEQSVVALSDGTLYCVYRTVAGHPVGVYSRDGGRNWTAPAFKEYEPGGRLIKHPRAANFVWRCGNGKYLYWFHNHGGRPARETPGWDPYADRNPAWLCAGEERDTPAGRRLFWSQPEVLLYDDDPYIRMSYPDLVEEAGGFWVTETQKNVGRVHELPRDLLAGLFGQFQNRTAAVAGRLADLRAPGETPAPRLPALLQRDNARADHGTRDLRGGLTLDLWLTLPDLEPGRVLATNAASGRGFTLTTAAGGSLRLELGDGRTHSVWESDRGALQAGRRHHVAVVVDGGPKIITYVVDGVLLDGGDQRQFGWGRFSPHLRDLNGGPRLTTGQAVERLRVYGRALRTSEAVGNFRAGPGG